MNYNYLRRSERMEVASMTLGIIALALCSCIYISIPLGALAITFGFLSMGNTKKMRSKAVTGVVLGIIAILVTICFYAITITSAIQEYGSIENILRYYCEMSGLDFDTYYGQFFN